jgi:hypothetical protein
LPRRIGFDYGSDMKTLALLPMLALAACVSTGRDFDESRLAAMQPGVTTPAEAVALLGPPQQRVTREDGGVSLTWVYVHSAFGSLTSKAAGLRFDSAGRLTRIAVR